MTVLLIFGVLAVAGLVFAGFVALYDVGVRRWGWPE